MFRVVVAFGLVMAAFAQCPPQINAGLEKIGFTIDTIVNKTHNATAFGMLFADNGVLMLEGENPIVGRADISSTAGQGFAGLSSSTFRTTACGFIHQEPGVFNASWAVAVWEFMAGEQKFVKLALLGVTSTGDNSDFQLAYAMFNGVNAPPSLNLNVPAPSKPTAADDDINAIIAGRLNDLSTAFNTAAASGDASPIGDLYTSTPFYCGFQETPQNTTAGILSEYSSYISSGSNNLTVSAYPNWEGFAAADGIAYSINEYHALHDNTPAAIGKDFMVWVLGTDGVWRIAIHFTNSNGGVP